MRRILGTAMVVLAALTAVSCGTTRRVPRGVPAFVHEHIRNAPPDVLVGIGAARHQQLHLALTVSTQRARAEIARQMGVIAMGRIYDHAAESEVDSQAATAFSDAVTDEIFRSSFSGARVVFQDSAADGTMWTVVWLDRSTAANEIDQAQVAARLAVPRAASLASLQGMHEAFDREARRVPQVNSGN